jgi:hypothetical protein
MISLLSRTAVILSLHGALLTSLSAQELPDPRRIVPLRGVHGQKIPEAPKAETLQLPPLPTGVQELNFKDFFKMPVGDYGLELTDYLHSLDGKRVRMLGYMVFEDLTRCNSCTIAKTVGGRPVPAWMEATVPGRMMFTFRPCAVSFSHYGLSDDLPPQTVFVTVPDKIGQLVPFTPGPLLLTGVLSVGPKKEMDGRISVVRLELDLPAEPPVASNSSTTTLPVSR